MRTFNVKDAQAKEKAIELLLKLRKKMPAISFFGDDNYKIIDLQIKVLKGEILESKVYSYGDSMASHLIDVFEWMREERSEWFSDLQAEFEDE